MWDSSTLTDVYDMLFDAQKGLVIGLQLAAPSLFGLGVLLGVHMCFCYFVCGWRSREFRRETRMPFGPQVVVLYSDRLFLGQLHVQSPQRSAAPARRGCPHPVWCFAGRATSLTERRLAVFPQGTASGSSPGASPRLHLAD